MFHIPCKFVLFRFLDFTVTLSAHFPGSLALWCSVAFVYVMCQFTANKYDTILQKLHSDGSGSYGPPCVLTDDCVSSVCCTLSTVSELSLSVSCVSDDF